MLLKFLNIYCNRGRHFMWIIWTGKFTNELILTLSFVLLVNIINMKKILCSLNPAVRWLAWCWLAEGFWCILAYDYWISMLSLTCMRNWWNFIWSGWQTRVNATKGKKQQTKRNWVCNDRFLLIACEQHHG